MVDYSVYEYIFKKYMFIAWLEAFKAYFDHAFFTLKTQSA